MKYLVLTLISVLFISAPGCQHATSNSSLEDGVIVGYDLSMCACCGGYFIEIGSTKYRFWQAPASCTIKLDSETMPLPVRVKWHKRPVECRDDIIVVDSLVKR